MKVLCCSTSIENLYLVQWKALIGGSDYREKPTRSHNKSLHAALKRNKANPSINRSVKKLDFTGARDEGREFMNR